jgi:DNA-binding transcriptional ArsR family regulator
LPLAIAASTHSTQNLFVALGHPTRRQILREMAGGPPASPRELTERLDDTLSNVSYHFRVLAESGVLKLVSTRPVRGSTQHFYGMEIDAEWARAVLALDERPEPNGGPQGEENA